MPRAIIRDPASTPASTTRHVLAWKPKRAVLTVSLLTGETVSSEVLNTMSSLDLSTAIEMHSSEDDHRSH